ncbi:MAG TPA: hypothetical protein VJR89_17030 [Polyangiales bacterium]|nr:hypothetical protein [Polyangiales bacterium]
MTHTDEGLLRSLGQLAREQQAEAEQLDLEPLSAADEARLRRRLLAASERRAAPGKLRWLRSGMAFGLPLCAAAAALLWLRRPEPLPQYVLEVANAPAQYRSGDAAPVEPKGPVQVYDTLRLRLRPATSVSGAVTATAQLRQGDVTQDWPLVARTSDYGAVQVELRRADTKLRGLADLTLQLEREGATQTWRLPVQLQE